MRRSLLLVFLPLLLACGQKTMERSPTEPGGVTAIVNVAAPLPASCVRTEEIVVRLNGSQVTVLPASATKLEFRFVAVIGVDYRMELALRSGTVLYSGPLDVKLIAEGIVNVGSISFECREALK